MATKARKDWGKLDAYLPLPSLALLTVAAAMARWHRTARSRTGLDTGASAYLCGLTKARKDWGKPPYASVAARSASISNRERSGRAKRAKFRPARNSRPDFPTSRISLNASAATSRKR
jgi:hypothetical protein